MFQDLRLCPNLLSLQHFTKIYSAIVVVVHLGFSNIQPINGQLGLLSDFTSSYKISRKSDNPALPWPKTVFANGVRLPS